MLFVGLLSWWYGAGWMQLVRRILTRISRTLDFFSVGLLLRTLFSPFKQISVGRVQGSVETQLRAWTDLQISRVIGAMVRLSVIGFGLLATLALCVFALALLVIWPLVPVLPFLALLLAIGGIV
jgi:hypothetical protein